MITPETTISLQGIMLFLGGIVALWTIMTGLLKIFHEVHDTRILVNVICKHLDINPDDIVGKK